MEVGESQSGDFSSLIDEQQDVFPTTPLPLMNQLFAELRLGRCDFIKTGSVN